MLQPQGLAYQTPAWHPNTESAQAVWKMSWPWTSHLIPSQEQLIHNMGVMINMHTSWASLGGLEVGADILLTLLVEWAWGSHKGEHLAGRTSDMPEGSHEAPQVIRGTSNEASKISINQNRGRSKHLPATLVIGIVGATSLPQSSTETFPLGVGDPWEPSEMNIVSK